MQTYRVGTFCAPCETRRSKVHAYTVWFNEAWSGCVVFEVEAESGKEAKRIAVDKRLAYEKGRRDG